MTEGADTSRIAGDWWRTIRTTAYVPLSSPDAVELLRSVLDRFGAILDTEPFDPEPAAALARELVRVGVTDPASIATAVPVLRQVAEQRNAQSADEYGRRLVAVTAWYGKGFAEALQDATLDAQETVQRAMATVRHRADEALRISDARFRAVFDNAAIAIAIADLHGRMIEVNPALAKMMHTSVGRLRGTSILRWVHSADRSRVFERVQREIVEFGKGSIELENRFYRDNGTEGIARYTATVVPSAGDQPAYLLGIGEDVTELRELESRMHHQARHDPLTGIPNRLMLQERLIEVIETAEPDDRIGLCFFDLDEFKSVNDRHGHGVGDRLLTAVADRLHRKAAKSGVLLARIGGDEFVAFLPPPAAEESAVAAAECLLGELSEVFVVDGLEFKMSASVGVVAPKVAGRNQERLLDAADAGLYRAKAERRGRWFLQT